MPLADLLDLLKYLSFHVFADCHSWFCLTTRVKLIWNVKEWMDPCFLTLGTPACFFVWISFIISSELKGCYSNWSLFRWSVQSIDRYVSKEEGNSKLTPGWTSCGRESMGWVSALVTSVGTMNWQGRLWSKIIENEDRVYGTPFCFNHVLLYVPIDFLVWETRPYP